jgi:hypothetical protein
MASILMTYYELLVYIQKVFDLPSRQKVKKCSPHIQMAFERSYNPVTNVTGSQQIGYWRSAL